MMYKHETNSHNGMMEVRGLIATVHVHTHTIQAIQ
jgi:hypothetical protein